MTIGKAALAALLICAGSFFAIVAPGDGQTAMFTFPLWLVGALLGIRALRLSFAAGSPRAVRWIVSLLALVALCSVGWSFVASLQYEAPGREGRQTHAG